MSVIDNLKRMAERRDMMDRISLAIECAADDLTKSSIDGPTVRHTVINAFKRVARELRESYSHEDAAECKEARPDSSKMETSWRERDILLFVRAAAADAKVEAYDEAMKIVSSTKVLGRSGLSCLSEASDRIRKKREEARYGAE